MSSPIQYVQRRKSGENTESRLTTYTYLYNCSRWWGYVSGVRNIVHESTSRESVLDAANYIAMSVTGSKTCDVKLLQKFHMTIALVEPYPALVQFPLSSESGEDI